MSTWTGQPQNVAIIVGGQDVSGANPLPISTASSTSSASPTNLAEVSVPTGTAAAITGTPTSATKEVVVYAPDSNSDVVYVGGSNLTVANGIKLVAGASKSYSITDARQIFCIASVSGQKLRVEVT